MTIDVISSLVALLVQQDSSKSSCEGTGGSTVQSKRCTRNEWKREEKKKRNRLVYQNADPPMSSSQPVQLRIIQYIPSSIGLPQPPNSNPLKILNPNREEGKKSRCLIPVESLTSSSSLVSIITKPRKKAPSTGLYPTFPAHPPQAHTRA